MEASWTGPELEPGLLREGSDGGLELSERRLDPGRDPRLLTGLDICLGDSDSKKLELEALLFRPGEDVRCDSVSIVLSARDGRGCNVLVADSSIGLLCKGDSLDAPPLDIFVMLGVRCRVKVP